VHKPARECPIAEPHQRGTCGIVKARERNQTIGDATDGRDGQERARPNVK